MIEIVDADLSLPLHIHAILSLLNDYALDLMGGQEALSDFVKSNLITELRQRQSAHVILSFISGNPAGLLISFEGFSTFACKPLLNIHDVVVAQKYRGRGISRKLLNRAEEVA